MDGIATLQKQKLQLATAAANQAAKIARTPQEMAQVEQMKQQIQQQQPQNQGA